MLSFGVSFPIEDVSMPLQNLKSDHPLGKAWILNTGLGIAGVVLNLIVLKICMNDCNGLISSINAMIM